MNKKIINYITFISLGLFTILLSLLILSEIITIPYEVRGKFIHFIYYRFTPAFLVIGSAGFIIKSLMAKSKPWTKWVSIGIFAFLTFTIGIRFIFFGGFLRTSERLIIYIITFIGVGSIIGTLFIKKYTITRWIAFSLFTLIAGISLLASIAIITNPYPKLIWEDSYILYQSLDNKKLKVINQVGDYGQKRARLIKDSKLPIRYSKRFKRNELNGRWEGYDEFGNIISKNTYKDGVIIVREPVIPNYAELISNVDSLLIIFENPTEDKYICLEGNFFFERPFKIKGAKNITLTKPDNVNSPILNSNYDGHYAIIIENCENITIDSLKLNLSSNYNKEPGIITIINCKNVIIRNCIITGQAKYAIYVDENNSNIIIKNNVFDRGYTSYGVKLSAQNTTLAYNSFFSLNRRDYLTDIDIPGAKLNRNKIPKLIKSALEKAEPYPFAETERNIKIGDKWITLFLGDPSDFFYYCGIYDVLDKYFADSYGSDMDCMYSYCFNLLYKMTGISPFITDVSKIKDKWAIADNEPKFNIVNPAFIEWMRENLLISPETEVAGVSMQELYNGSFYRFFRLMTETYLYLHYELDVDEEIRFYKRSTNDYYLTSKLYNRYKDILQDYNTNEYSQLDGEEEEEYEEEYYDEGDYYEEGYEGDYGNEGEYYEEGDGYYEENYYDHSPFFMDANECMGFWLRREIGGSAAKLFDMLAEFIELYDTEWFEETSIKYGYSKY